MIGTDILKQNVKKIVNLSDDGYDFIALFINNRDTIVWCKNQLRMKSIAIKLFQLEVDEKKFYPGYGVKFVKRKYTFFDSFQMGKYDYLILRTPTFQMFYDEMKNFSNNIYEDIFPKNILTQEQALKFVDSLNIPKIPRDYQLDCFIHSINSKYSTNVSATSSGKSLMIYMIAMYMRSMKNKTLIVVPTITLLNQMYNDFIDYGISNEIIVERVGGGNKCSKNHPDIVITTWQSLVKNFPYSINSFKCAIVDECHLLKSNGSKLGEFLLPKATEVDYRFGFSGTLPSNSVLKQNIFSICGAEHSIITSRELIDSGNATEAKIHKLVLIHDFEESSKFKTRAFFDVSERFKFEEKFLCESESRNNFLIKLINKCQNIGNTLILYKTKEWGIGFIEDYLKKALKFKNFDLVCGKIDALKFKSKTQYCLFGENEIENFVSKNGVFQDVKSLDNRNIYLIDGDISGERREFIRQRIQNSNNCVLFGTYQCISTGINIPNLEHLIFTFTSKSEILISQSIGRLLRKCDGKHVVNVFDLVDKFSGYTSYSQKHFVERKKLYDEQNFPITEQTIVL